MLRIQEVVCARLRDPIYRNANFLFASTLSTSLFGFLFWALASRFSAVGVVGNTVSIVSLIQLVVSFSLIGATSSIIYFLPKREWEVGKMLNSFLLACLTVATLLFIAIGIIALSASVTIGSLLDDPGVFLIVVLLGNSRVIVAILGSYYTAERTTEWLFITTTFEGLTRILGIVVLVILRVHLSYSLLLALWLVSVLPTSLLGLILLVPHIDSSYSMKSRASYCFLRRSFVYSFSSWTFSFLYTLPAYFIPLLLAESVNSEATAYFFIAWMFSGILTAFVDSVSVSSFVEGSYAPQEILIHLKKSLKYLTLILFPAIAVFLIAGQLLLEIPGEEYAEKAYIPLIILSISNIPGAVSFQAATVKRIKGKMIFPNIIYGSRVILLLFFYIILFSGPSLLSICLSWLASQVVVAIPCMILILKELRFRDNEPS